MSRYEMPDGSWDMDREEADYQQYELERAGREAYRAHRKALARLLKGDATGAAQVCPHSSRMKTVCRDCGAELTAQPPVALAAGPFGCPKCGEPLTIAGELAECQGDKAHQWRLK